MPDSSETSPTDAERIQLLRDKVLALKKIAKAQSNTSQTSTTGNKEDELSFVNPPTPQVTPSTPKPTPTPTPNGGFSLPLANDYAVSEGKLWFKLGNDWVEHTPDVARGGEYDSRIRPTYNPQTKQVERAKYNPQTNSFEFTSSPEIKTGETLWGKDVKTGKYGAEVVPRRNDQDPETYVVRDAFGKPYVSRRTVSNVGREIHNEEDEEAVPLDSLDQKTQDAIVAANKDKLQEMFPDLYPAETEDPDKIGKQFVQQATEGWNKFWSRHPGAEYALESVARTFIDLGTNKKFLSDLDRGVSCFRGLMRGILNGQIMNACAYTIYGAFATMDCLSDSTTSFEGQIRRRWNIFTDNVANNEKRKLMEKDLAIADAVRLDLTKVMGECVRTMIDDQEELSGAEPSELTMVQDGDVDALYTQKINQFTPQGIRTYLEYVSNMRAMTAVQLKNLQDDALADPTEIPGNTKSERQRYLEMKLNGLDQLVNSTLGVALESKYISSRDAQSISEVCYKLGTAQQAWVDSENGKRIKQQFESLTPMEQFIYGGTVGAYSKGYNNFVNTSYFVPNLCNDEVRSNLSPIVNAYRLLPASFTPDERTIQAVNLWNCGEAVADYEVLCKRIDADQSVPFVERQKRKAALKRGLEKYLDAHPWRRSTKMGALDDTAFRASEEYRHAYAHIQKTYEDELIAGLYDYAQSVPGIDVNSGDRVQTVAGLVELDKFATQGLPVAPAKLADTPLAPLSDLIKYRRTACANADKFLKNLNWPELCGPLNTSSRNTQVYQKLLKTLDGYKNAALFSDGFKEYIENSEGVDSLIDALKSKDISKIDEAVQNLFGESLIVQNNVAAQTALGAFPSRSRMNQNTFNALPPEIKSLFNNNYKELNQFYKTLRSGNIPGLSTFDEFKELLVQDSSGNAVLPMRLNPDMRAVRVAISDTLTKLNALGEFDAGGHTEEEYRQALLNRLYECCDNACNPKDMSDVDRNKYLFARADLRLAVMTEPIVTITPEINEEEEEEEEEVPQEEEAVPKEEETPKEEEGEVPQEEVPQVEEEEEEEEPKEEETKEEEAPKEEEEAPKEEEEAPKEEPIKQEAPKEEQSTGTEWGKAKKRTVKQYKKIRKEQIDNLQVGDEASADLCRREVLNTLFLNAIRDGKSRDPTRAELPDSPNITEIEKYCLGEEGYTWDRVRPLVIAEYLSQPWAREEYGTLSRISKNINQLQRTGKVAEKQLWYKNPETGEILVGTPGLRALETQWVQHYGCNDVEFAMSTVFAIKALSDIESRVRVNEKGAPQRLKLTAEEVRASQPYEWNEDLRGTGFDNWFNQSTRLLPESEKALVYGEISQLYAALPDETKKMMDNIFALGADFPTVAEVLRDQHKALKLQNLFSEMDQEKALLAEYRQKGKQEALTPAQIKDLALNTKKIYKPFEKGGALSFLKDEDDELIDQLLARKVSPTGIAKWWANVQKWDAAELEDILKIAKDSGSLKAALDNNLFDSNPQMKEHAEALREKRLEYALASAMEQNIVRSMVAYNLNGANLESVGYWMSDMGHLAALKNDMNVEDIFTSSDQEPGFYFNCTYDPKSGTAIARGDLTDNSVGIFVDSLTDEIYSDSQTVWDNDNDRKLAEIRRGVYYRISKCKTAKDLAHLVNKPVGTLNDFDKTTGRERFSRSDKVMADGEELTEFEYACRYMMSKFVNWYIPKDAPKYIGSMFPEHAAGHIPVQIEFKTTWKGDGTEKYTKPAYYIEGSDAEIILDTDEHGVTSFKIKQGNITRPLLEAYQNSYDFIERARADEMNYMAEGLFDDSARFVNTVTKSMLTRAVTCFDLFDRFYSPDDQSGRIPSTAMSMVWLGFEPSQAGGGYVKELNTANPKRCYAEIYAGQLRRELQEGYKELSNVLMQKCITGAKGSSEFIAPHDFGRIHIHWYTSKSQAPSEMNPNGAPPKYLGMKITLGDDCEGDDTRKAEEIYSSPILKRSNGAIGQDDVVEFNLTYPSCGPIKSRDLYYVLNYIQHHKQVHGENNDGNA